MEKLTWESGAFSFEGCVSLQKEDGWVSPWRIDWPRRDFYPFLKDDSRPHWTAPPAQQCSGVRIVFAYDGENLSLEMAEPREDLLLDLYVDSLFTERVSPQPGDRIIRFSPLPRGMKEITLWLDQRDAFRLKNLIVDVGSRVERITPRRKRWIHYGSSISHSRQADGPSHIWPSRVARELDLHLTNLGFASNCVLESMIARQIGELPADFITLKLGINVYDGDLTRRTFPPSVIGMVQIIREKHPDTPLALISPLINVSREEARGTPEGLSLREMREVIADTVEICRNYGDRNIYYADGLQLLGEEDLSCLIDGTHPGPQGQPLLAERFIRQVFSEKFSFPEL